MGIKPTREQAMEIFIQYNSNESLVKHALAVEAVMRHYAAKLGEDADKWGVIGLLHDLDYEQYPQEHCAKSAEILREKDVDEEYIHAVVSHGYTLCSDVKPEHVMEQVLFATDELTGLITATVLMRPSKSILDLTTSSVRKKFKSSGFAAGVNRDIIRMGAEMLNATVDDLITECIAAMQAQADTLGLRGAL